MNNYQIRYRKAKPEDYHWEIAQIIYGTDPYIYPSWSPSAESFADNIAPLMRQPGFIFNYDNIYIAEQFTPHGSIPIAAATVLTKRTNLQYNYRPLQAQASRVINEYIMPTIKEVQELPDHVACGLALSVDLHARGEKIGEDLFHTIQDSLKKQGIDTLYFTCLKNNQIALGLYRKMGFRIINDGIGFSKTGDSQPVSIVTLRGTF